MGDTDVMECPNLFPLGDKWVLCVSPYDQVVYKIGTLRDQRFHPETGWRPMDLGGRAEFYAPNSMLDPKGRRIQWGWVQGGPPGGSWNGVLTLPRVISLRADGLLGIEPLPELVRLRGRHLRGEDLIVADRRPVRLTGVAGAALEIRSIWGAAPARAQGSPEPGTDGPRSG